MSLIVKNTFIKWNLGNIWKKNEMLEIKPKITWNKWTWYELYLFLFLQCYELKVTILLSLILNFILDESFIS